MSTLHPNICDTGQSPGLIQVANFIASSNYCEFWLRSRFRSRVKILDYGPDLELEPIWVTCRHVDRSEMSRY